MSFVSVFSIVGIIVLALAVIALAVNVAGISSRLKDLTDSVMFEPMQGRRRAESYDDLYDLPPRRSSTPSYPVQERRVEKRRAPAIQRGSAPQRSSIPQRNSLSQMGNGSPRDNYSAGYHDAGMGSDYDYSPSSARDSYPGNSQPFAPVQTSPSGMRQNYASPGFAQDESYDDEFFETYRERDDDRGYLRGRGRPTIPFGADMNVVDRRRDSYVGSVADSDYDPDSIDFTRVQGYRRAGGRY